MGFIGRAADANANRAREGLRVAEDIARFHLQDAELSERIKTLRHRITRGCSALAPGGAASRDSEGDVGRRVSVADEWRRAGLAAVLTANLRRAQEALRVLEETAKLDPGEGADDLAAAFKELRYEVYSLESEMEPRVRGAAARDALSGLYVILDRGAAPGGEVVALGAAALAGGARIIQIRDKSDDAGRFLRDARALRTITREAGAILIINDRPDIAALVGADGVHVGQKDLPPQAVRELVGPQMIVGFSTHSEEELAAAPACDYIAVGPVFATQTKAAAGAPVGLELVRRAAARVDVPLAAIGGIDETTAQSVRGAGADMVCVIGCVAASPDPSAAVRRLVDACTK